MKPKFQNIPKEVTGGEVVMNGYLYIKFNTNPKHPNNRFLERLILKLDNERPTDI